MNLDDLMEVWRSQHASPLYGMNKTLLELALRQEQKKLQAHRRLERWIVYLASVFLIVVMALFFAIMIYPNDVMTGWDLVIPITGAVAALIMGVAAYTSYRVQVRREQSFGDSLRDQLRRRIVQLDYQATRAVRLADIIVVAGFVAATALMLVGMRLNSEPNEPFDDWEAIVGGILICAFSSIAGAWEMRRAVKRSVLPRKQLLEGLLKELDSQQ